MVSCESNEKPPERPKPYIPKHELEGTWIGYDKKDTKHEDYKLELKINSDGNITFSPRPYRQEVEFVVTNIITNNTVTITNIVTNTITNICNYTYNGKIETNAITYPYDAEVFCRLTDGGTFKFSSSSNCTANYDRIDFEYKDGYINLSGTTVEFTIII